MSKTVLYHGKIYLERGSFAQALLQEDGIIRAVGTDEEILSLAGDAERIDCGGKTVVPGFNDSHMHLLHTGKVNLFPDLTKARCAADLTKMCREFLKKHPENQGFAASGWNEDTWREGERARPTKAHIDAVSDSIPIVLSRVCIHACCVNSFVLRQLGIDRDHTVFLGEPVEVDENGEPTGILTENAVNAALATVPELTHEELKRAFLEASALAASYGLTTVQSNDIGYVLKDHEACCNLIKEVYAEGKGKVRYTGQLFFDSTEQLRAYCEGPRFKESFADDWFNRGPLKILKDGSLGARTATMRGGYADDPTNHGVEVHSNAEILEMVECANAHGLQAAIHAIGDQAVEDIIHIFETVNADRTDNPNRHSIVHCQITDIPLLRRVRDNHLLVAYQPIFLEYDLHMAESRVGPDLIRTSYAFRTAKELGIHACYGTDCPVESMNPLACIYAAVTRKDLNHFPEGGFNPAECVDVETAVDAYTIESAYHEFREDRKGRLRPGFYADLVILDKDIFTCPPDEILDIRPTLTMVGGKIVFSRA